MSLCEVVRVAVRNGDVVPQVGKRQRYTRRAAAAGEEDHSTGMPRTEVRVRSACGDNAVQCSVRGV